MSYQVSLGQSLKNMMQSEFQNRLGNQKSIFTNDKSIFTNDISLILERGTMIDYIWSHAPPCTSSNSHLIYIVVRCSGTWHLTKKLAIFLARDDCNGMRIFRKRIY